ncbi:MAG TPA: hypothetical protein VKA14_07105 [Gammaproteobacteria bacterium]|nr:hypothetical protein [Gammaproteobacteria bacterium]
MTPKKVAVLVRHNQSEALRVAGGLTLADHEVAVFVVDKALAGSPEVEEQLEVLEFAEIEPVTAVPEDDSGAERIGSRTLAQRLPDFDAVLAI